MQVTVIGCGYLGAVHAAVMAEFGHDVTGVEVDERKVEALSAGTAPFYEPGLPEVLAASLASGRLRFTWDIAEAIRPPSPKPTIYFICVGTPQRQGENAADTQYVYAAVQALLPHLRPGDVVVGKSTVPVGTATQLTAMVTAAQPDACLVWNPEFLREAYAVNDTRQPDRIVLGLPADEAQAAHAEALLRQVYAPCLAAGVPVVITDLPTAEMVKVAANAFLATKISFINAMAEVCEASGADVTSLATAIGYDDRIGHKFLGAGLGFGGGCLPKDIRAFMARAGELGADQALSFLREVDAINLRRRARMIDLTRAELGDTLAGRRIAVLGASFKPESDDIRDSPALNVAELLHQAGAEVTVTDPVALHNVAAQWPDLRLEPDPMVACADADIVLLLTEWRQYRELDPAKLGEVVADQVILDGRNALDPQAWRAAGWRYRALGRPRV